MQIERLSLKGFFRFTDPVTLDFREIPPGLIALRGPIGEGKTTLLEAPLACLLRSLPSRNGKLTTYATGRDSYLELEFSVSGRGAYRIRVNLDGVKDGSDAIIETINADGSKTVLNDGKVTTFDQVIAREFPSKELLLASAFSAQNKRGNFIGKKPAERKDLFTELLGLKALERMSDTAKTLVGFIDQSRARVQAVRDELARQTDDATLAALDQQQADLAARAAETTQLRDATRDALATIEARLATMQDVVAAFGAATQRIQTLKTEVAVRQQEVAGLATDRARAQAQLTADIARVDQKLQSDLKALDEAKGTANVAHNRELATINQKRATDEQDCRAKIAGNNKLMAMADQVREAVAQIEHARQRIEGRQGDLRALDTQVSDATALVAQCERDIAALTAPEQALARAQTDATLLETVPCGGEGPYAACQFLTNAKAAQGRIPELTAAVAPKAQRVADREALQRLLADLQARLKALRIETATDEALIRQHQTMAAYAQPLAAAEARLVELKDLLQKVHDDAKHAAADAARRHQERIAELEARRPVIEADAVTAREVADQRYFQTTSDLSAREEALLATIARLTADLATAETDLTALTGQNEVVTALHVDLRTARATWDRLTGVLATVTAEQQALARRRTDLQDARRRRQGLDATLATLDTERLEWQTLQDALGRDGLPVLEIDAAGPTISALVNELLTVCFGPRFSVELITQQAKVSGKGMKEVFSLRVLDNERGIEHDDVTDLSGGEQAIVSEALMNAIAIYVNQRSPMPVRTLWRDETTGSLDEETALKYVAMLRKVLELSGAQHIFFVTHNRAAAELADVQIVVGDGKATLALPPYAEYSEAA
jgi:exonuclease SbcC